MKLKYSKNVNDQINQVTKNMDQLFGLFSTVQKQVEKLSHLIVDETAETTQKVGKEFIDANSTVADEIRRVAQENFDNTVKTVFTESVEQ